MAVSPKKRTMSAAHRDQLVRKQLNKNTCMCSPTTHPGSFRCSLHKMMPYSPNRLNARKSAMANSLVKRAERGDLEKRALAALIRPSSHQQRRRSVFEPRPSRLSSMSKADDL
ncbi:serine-rich protein-related protein [Artemisia annua]|uniref:Serine-rich protein-related protein n=1 Tax=Artemisia annua TaxID=35608 RepID=A0A2U1Q709_ARTAN|nr:serine-rich protein-related protein [Artemisia annua]